MGIFYGYCESHKTLSWISLMLCSRLDFEKLKDHNNM